MKALRKWAMFLLEQPLRALGLYLYEYPKPDCTATVVVLFNAGARVLVITRKHEPFQGKRALPGGFLEVGKEKLRRTARRELREETGLDFAEQRFVFVDERSDAHRDPRGHIVDHGWMVVVAESETSAVLAQLHADDDADDAAVIEVSELRRQGMAFDHLQLLEAALAKAGVIAS